MKIIRDSKYGELLGAHIVGAHAAELIHAWRAGRVSLAARGLRRHVCRDNA